MALKKCPLCELNYIKDDEKICNLCRRENKHVLFEPAVHEAEIAICTECGEAPAKAGSEFCDECQKEQKRQVELEMAADLDAEFEEAIAADNAEEAEDEE